jgi:hypothetical protein
VNTGRGRNAVAAPDSRILGTGDFALLIAGACRAVYDLVAERRPDPSNDDWGFLEERGFFRKGVYFSFRGEMEVYARIREQMLERGFYLSPSFPPVNIIPGEYSAGELKSFRIALEEAT